MLKQVQHDRRVAKERVMVDPVRPILISDIEQARERIKGTVLRTSLVKLDLGSGGLDIRLKLENLQPTNAYKIRGGANAVAALSDEARSRGVWTISAGNAGQGVAYAARAFGIPCTVVAIETAPQTKLDRMRTLGAEIVPVSYDRAWVAAETHEFPDLDAPGVRRGDHRDAQANRRCDPAHCREIADHRRGRGRAVARGRAER